MERRPSNCHRRGALQHGAVPSTQPAAAHAASPLFASSSDQRATPRLGTDHHGQALPDGLSRVAREVACVAVGPIRGTRPAAALLSPTPRTVVSRNTPPWPAFPIRVVTLSQPLSARPARPSASGPRCRRPLPSRWSGAVHGTSRVIACYRRGRGRSGTFSRGPRGPPAHLA
jgi:hypothetical protein